MAIVSINDVLRQEILENLQGSEAILVKTITDLTSQVGVGQDRTTIPKTSGLSLSDVATGGAEAVAGGMTTTSSVLLLNQSKEVAEMIYLKDGLQSAIDLENSFLANAPKVYAQGIEAAIAAALATPSANDFESSATGSGNFNIADIAKAKRKMDEARVSAAGRTLVVNAAGMEILSSMQEFQDGSKSLTAEALREGYVSRVKGFLVKQSEDVAANKIHCYSPDAVVFAMQAGVEYVQEEHKSKGRKFVALRGMFGVVDADNAGGAGVRKLTISCAA